MKFQANGEIREGGKKIRRINSESFGRACYLCVCQWGGLKAVASAVQVWRLST